MSKILACVLLSFVLSPATQASSRGLTAEPAEKIRKSAELVSLQSSRRASIQEAIQALGHPSYVIESRYYKAANLLFFVSPEFPITLAWDQGGCTIAYLTFDDRNRATGSVAFGVNYRKGRVCPDSTYLDDLKILAKYGCSKANAHSYCGNAQVQKTAMTRAPMFDYKRDYARRLEDEILDMGFDARVKITGQNNDVMTITFALMSRPLANRLNTKLRISENANALGIRKLIYADQGEGKWTVKLE